MTDKVTSMAELKLNDSLFSILILSIFCGILMFIAVDTFKESQGSTIKVIAVFVPVMVFILSGFEHVIANMYYFAIANTWTFDTIIALIVMTIGNSIGGMLIPIYQRLFRLKA